MIWTWKQQHNSIVMCISFWLSFAIPFFDCTLSLCICMVHFHHSLSYAFSVFTFIVTFIFVVSLSLFICTFIFAAEGNCGSRPRCVTAEKNCVSRLRCVTAEEKLRLTAALHHGRTKTAQEDMGSRVKRFLHTFYTPSLKNKGSCKRRVFFFTHALHTVYTRFTHPAWYTKARVKRTVLCTRVKHV